VYCDNENRELVQLLFLHRPNMSSFMIKSEFERFCDRLYKNQIKFHGSEQVATSHKIFDITLARTRKI
jgi:hypothetical protein